MKINKFAITTILITLLLTFGMIWFFSKASQEIEVTSSDKVTTQIEKTIHDWGTISMAKGKVEAVFDIKNEGQESLKLYNVATSCTCTTAQLKKGEEKSPLFGMHGKSDYILEISSGETAQVEVVYDPAFHGPGGVGPITRQITVQTNDASNPELSFTVSANVTK